MKNQPSKINTGHGSSRCRPGGGTSHQSSQKTSTPSKPSSGKTGNRSRGGSKRSKP